MQYTQVDQNAFKELQLNAGILVDSFTPSSGVLGNILGATTGGINFTATPSYTDFGEDVDNVPNNMKEYKHLDYYDIHMTGTFLTVTADLAKMLVGAADESSGKVTPRIDLDTDDFDEIWWVGDYSDNNDGASTAGYVAIHMKNVLNVGGFQIQSTKNGKGQFAFDFQAHYSINSQSEVPFEVYVKTGTAAVGTT